MLLGMHLTPIGEGNVLLEPSEGLDPGDPDAYLEDLVRALQTLGARRLIYDLKSIPVIDRLYYDWLRRVHHVCQITGVELVAANMRPAAAFGLTTILEGDPPFVCALDVDSAR